MPALNRRRAALNAVVKPIARAGLGPRDLFLLTVPGRRTGRRHSTPVMLVAHGGERWLVAPYGEREWVRNARAAGRVELRRGRRRIVAAATELAPEERAPVLAAYVRRVPFVAGFFAASPGDPPAAFEAEAARHPVFRLRPQP